MNICVASGKGGTGKTTIAVSLARVTQRSSYVDCDVEAPNGHLFLRPNAVKTTDVTRIVAKVDLDKCTFCGECMDACVYNAIVVAEATQRALVFDDLCMGCGVCDTVCPAGAIIENNVHAGVVTDGFSGTLPTREGRMDTSAPHAHPTLEATLAELPDTQVVVLDAEPGVTGRVVETVRNCDVCLLVTEPTPFGLHDLRLAVQMTRFAETPTAVIINRSDLGDDSVRRFCEAEEIPVLLEIPFDKRIAAGYAVGRTLTETRPDLIPTMEGVFRSLKALAEGREVGR